MRDITSVIVHCSATPNGRPHDVSEIRRWHMVERGWSDIGYHFVITIDGQTQDGRRIEIPGAHARGNNQDSIGVCLIGTDRFTDGQEKALEALLVKLSATYGDGLEILGHRDLPNVKKECPGFDVRAWMDGDAWPLITMEKLERYK